MKLGERVGESGCKELDVIVELLLDVLMVELMFGVTLILVSESEMVFEDISDSVPVCVLLTLTSFVGDIVVDSLRVNVLLVEGMPAVDDDVTEPTDFVIVFESLRDSASDTLMVAVDVVVIENVGKREPDAVTSDEMVVVTLSVKATVSDDATVADGSTSMEGLSGPTLRLGEGNSVSLADADAL